MVVIDLIKQPNHHLWGCVLDEIQYGNDSLKENYLSIDFSQFLSFPCVIENDRVIAFSGLQYDESKWGPGIGRCSSRMWIHPEYRISNLKKFKGGPQFLNSYYIVPMQIKRAKDYNLQCIFVSREHNKNGFDQYLKLLHTNTGYMFTSLKNRYWVCGDSRLSSCLQYVGVCDLNSMNNERWHANMFKFIHH